MSNVIQLFPNPTDRQYEDKLIPILVDSLVKLASQVQDGEVDGYLKLSDSLLRFACRVLLDIDLDRREGRFKDGKMPSHTAFDIDNLAADCVLAFGGKDSDKVAWAIRNRVPVRGIDNE